MAHRHLDNIWLDLIEVEFQMREHPLGAPERADLEVRLGQLEKEYEAATRGLIKRESARAARS